MLVVTDIKRAKSKTEFVAQYSAEVLAKDFVSINDARDVLGVGYVVYVRRLLLEGKLEGVKVQYKGYAKWHISRASIAWYRKNVLRTMSGRRWIMKFELTDEAAVRAALDSLGIDYELKLNFVSKKK